MKPRILTAGLLSAGFFAGITVLSVAGCSGSGTTGSPDAPPPPPAAPGAGATSLFKVVSSPVTATKARAVTVKSSNQTFQISLQAGWNLFSMPFANPTTFALDKPASVLSCFSYNAATASYVKQAFTQAGFQAASPNPYQGYWVFCSTPVQLTLNGDNSTQSPVQTNLGGAWNLVGTPLSGDVAATGLQFNSQSLADAATSSLLGKQAFTYSPVDSAYHALSYQSGVFPAFQAAWVFAFNPGILSTTTTESADLTPTAISGVAARGNNMLSGAVTAVTVNSDGSNGTMLGTGAVSSDGSFTVGLGSVSTGPIRVTVAGGSYVSELDGTTQTTSFSLTSVVDSAQSIPPVLAITPLTTFVDSLTSSQASAGTAWATEHQTANSSIMSSYGFPAGTIAETVVPSFSSTASGAALQALAVLGGLESEAVTLGLTDRGSLVSALAGDVSDGIFDGKANGSPVPLSIGSLPATAGIGLFVTGVRAFASAQSSQIPPLSTAAPTIEQAIPTSSVATGMPVSNPGALQAAVNQGFADLEKNTYAGYAAAVTDFSLASNLAGTQVSNLADTARLFYAATQMGNLGATQPSPTLTTAGGFLTALGITTTNVTTRPRVTLPATCPSTSPTGDQVRAFLQGTLQNALISSINSLNAIQPTFTFSHSDPTNANLPVTSDYADVLAVRAFYEFALAGVLEASEYNLGGATFPFLNSGDITAQAFLSTNANALNQVDTSYLNTIQTLLSSGTNDVTALVAQVQARPAAPAGSAYLLTITSSPAQVTQALTKVAFYKSYLTLAGAINAKDGSTAQVNLPFYFANGLSLRPFVPPFLGNKINGPLQGTPFGNLYSGFTAGTQTDPNFALRANL